METGSATAYALNMVQERGETFVSPDDDVYSGMVVGEHNRPSDLDVNPCRAKKVTNMRASGHDEAVRLIPPKRRSLEEVRLFVFPNIFPCLTSALLTFPRLAVHYLHG